MPDVRQILYEQHIKPALQRILPTVMGRVKSASGGSLSKYRVDVEIPEFGNNLPDQDGSIYQRKDGWMLLRNVPVTFTSNIISAALQPGDAVWINFLGNSRNEPRIIGLAGKYPNDSELNTTLAGRADFRELPEDAYAQHEKSGATLPDRTVRRGLR
jgi:hypothetical protein